jgi:phosphate/sulfate permease
MSEKELGRALLNLDAGALAGASDPHAATQAILAGDRRRVWWWSAITIFFWIAALLMVVGMLVAMGLLLPFEAHLRDPAQVARIGLTPQQLEEAQHNAHVISRMITVGVTVSVGVLALAAGSTVLLVRASRRATLRQINASLLKISEQLKALRK